MRLPVHTLGIHDFGLLSYFHLNEIFFIPVLTVALRAYSLKVQFSLLVIFLEVTLKK